MNLQTPKEFCKLHTTCTDGAAFAGQFSTLAEVWDNCHRADWLFWMIEKAGIKGLDRELRLFACKCAENCKPTDPRSIAAIAVSRRYANGEATDADLDEAMDAAREVAREAVVYAANYAAWGAYRTTAMAEARAKQATLLRSFVENPFMEQTK